MIQTPYDCESFTPNENLNLTCIKNNSKKRCVLITDREDCRDFELRAVERKENEN
jgi:hypothetical protein